MHDRVANLVGAAALTIGDQLTAAATAAAGTSASGAAALMALHYQPGLGITELGTRIGLSQPAAVRMVDALEAAGLVKRQRPGGRAISVRLTASGARAAERARQAKQDVLVRTVSRLPATQRKELERALVVVLDGLYDDVRSEHVVCRLCDRDACLAKKNVCPVGRAARERGGGPDG
ncbi:MarR family winged helix-turn-helix transcriptional regulator [Fodinicola acaciae]|uniref:MarR family winged helix-turn-helix transcriptional regulator n=1 Tax=Fodinicola acaciae TaxID=2681555 RepID=UPI0013D52B69|nr:MarR family transcriptional regulator [Fodinicola acaciae]